MQKKTDTDNTEKHQKAQSEQDLNVNDQKAASTEVGGPKGLEPTRYGDWERRGRCIDF